MSDQFQYAVFLSHSAKDKRAVSGPNVVRSAAGLLHSAFVLLPFVKGSWRNPFTSIGAQ